MPLLKNIETGEVFTTRDVPQLVNGVWEGGDCRFMDQDGDKYEVVAPPALSWSNAPANYWWIDVGPFFDRFGAKALGVTSSTDPLVAGLVTLLMPRKYVDLKRADLPQMLAVLVAKALITEAEKQTILTAPTTEYERHIKGLPQPEIEPV